ncbi:MAG: glycosyltransferase family 2 protein [Deltaproteobacteria bacterium]|nr:glycosyltransferase family 2 protein [Deltaproteobacteria bacterium]
MGQNKRPHLSIVAPVYNEEETLPELYRRLQTVLSEMAIDDYEIVLIDDGSVDRSHELMVALRDKDPRVVVLKLSRNFGHHVAMTAGLDHAEGDFVIIMDSDLQDRPEAIPDLYAKINDGFDVVVADRQNKQFGAFKRLTSWIFHSLMRRLIGEFTGGVFRIMKRKVVIEVRRCREQERLVVGLIDWTGFETTSIPVAHGARFAGASKYNLGAQIRLAINSITSFSTLPLRMVSWLGFVTSGLTFIFGAYLVFRRFYWGLGVEGWTSTLVMIGFLGGVQLLALGIIGEYVGRIFNATRNRPLYVLDHEHSPGARSPNE